MKRYAEGTSVPISRTRIELETLLQKHGASQLATYHDVEQSFVQFSIKERMVRLRVKVPTRAACTPKNFVGLKKNGKSEEQVIDGIVAQRTAEAWRRLLLVVKAKLELIADGDSSFEREFLADVLLPDGTTVYEQISAPIAKSYQTGGMPKLLGR